MWGNEMTARGKSDSFVEGNELICVLNGVLK